MRVQGQLPPGPLTVDDVLRALERLERRSPDQLLLRRELRRIQERTPAGSQPASIVEGNLTAAKAEIVVTFILEALEPIQRR